MRLFLVTESSSGSTRDSTGRVDRSCVRTAEI